MPLVRFAAAVALVLALAPAAGAAEVAREGAVSLHAEVRRGELCLTIFHRARQFGEECGDPPYSAFRVIEVPGPGNTFGLAVAPSVSEVEVAVHRRPSTASAEGFDARFAIVHMRPVHILRLFDSAGVMIGANVSAEPLETRRVTVARAGGARLMGYRSDQLVPDPIELDRTFTEACVELVRDRSSLGTCVYSGLGRIRTRLLPACRSAPAVLGGVVPAAADSVVVVLGDGRRLRARTHMLPLIVAARAFALPVPSGQAIRSVTVDGEQGEVVATAAVRHEPAGALCPPTGSRSTVFEDSADLIAQRPAGALQAAATDGGHRLLVADARGERGMCSGIDALPDRLPCGPVTPDPELAAVFRQGGAVAAILGREVASVDLRLTDGSLRRVPTGAGERYTGRYAGHARFGRYAGDVRFFVAAVPRGTVREAILRDAGGHELARHAVSVRDDPQVAGRRRLAGLRVTALRQPGLVDTELRPELCVHLDGVRLGDLELPGDPFLCERRRADAPLVVTAPCRRARSALVGVARPGRVPRVVLADGRVIRPLVAKLGRARLWVARPPRRAAVRRPVRLPPRSEQCGYAGFSA
jgi:hypothetical protein